MWTSFFNANQVTDWNTANKSDRAMYGEFFHLMLEEGVYLAPSQFEAAFVSSTHDDESIERTVSAAEKAFEKLQARRTR